MKGSRGFYIPVLGVVFLLSMAACSLTPVPSVQSSGAADRLSLNSRALGISGNPFVTSIYTADPSAHVWSDGRLYVYPSHDVDPNIGCDLMDRYHVYSTADMVNWRDEGEILRASQVAWGRAEGGFMWAPDAAYKNGTYYYYFPHPSGTDWGATWKIGVATSSKPASDFTVQGYIPGLESLIDPMVFQDDTGIDYFYYGGGGVVKGGKLKANMVEIDGAMQTMTGLQDFHEASWVFKRNGLYYFTYADNYTQASGGDNRMRYATSTSPLGPWTYRGILMDPTDSFCAHGSIVQYKGQWYCFYFNSVLSGNDWLRTICVDLLTFNADGTIQKVVPTTAGVPANGTPPAPNPNTVKYEAENAVVSGAVVANDSAASGGKAIQNLHVANSYVQFNNVSGGSTGGRAELDFRFAAQDTSKLRLLVNGVDYSFINTVTTGGWSSYIGKTTFTVTLSAGNTNTIRVTGGNGGINLDYVNVSPFDGTVSPSPSPTPTPGATKYEAENGTAANGATIANDSAASGGKVIQNLHIVNSSVQINSINGVSGGSKSLRFYYASAEASAVTLYVNGTSAGSVSFPSTGGWSSFTGNVLKTVTLNSGSSNNIRVVGGSGGVNLDYVTVQ